MTEVAAPPVCSPAIAGGAGWRLTIAMPRPALAIALFSFGFLAVQRFTLHPVNSLVCALPFGLFVLYLVHGHRRTALSCLILALFMSVDNGGGIYAETPSLIRYAIYVSAIALLFFLVRWQIPRKAMVLAGLLLSALLLGALVSSAIGDNPFDAGTLRRDLMALFVLAAFLLARDDSAFDARLVYVGSLGYLVGEFINALFLYNTFPDYLSYDSLKAFIVFPLIYAMTHRKPLPLQVLLAVATLYVIFLYGTRMITLSFLALFLAAFIVGSIQQSKGKMLLIMAMIAVLMANVDLAALLGREELILLKALSFFLVLLENYDPSDIFAMFAALDPVRFAEHQLFFSRHLLQVLLGSGLGSGIFDEKGLLGFVTFEQTAFTVEEIRSSIFFNLHDFWIDYGLRFGLLPAGYLIYLLTLREMIEGRRWRGVLFGIVLLNTSFATSGMLLTALLVKFFPREAAR